MTKISYTIFERKCSSDDGSNGPIILQYMPLIGETFHPYSRTQSESQNYDPEKVGQNRKDSLGILNLPISTAATEREIKVQYRCLARIYHPDKYDPTTNKMSKSEAQEHFKLINNAYEYLRT